MTMAAADWLELFKSNEPKSSIASVADDLHAKKIIAAWEMYPFFEWEPPGGDPPDDLRDAWEILWEGFDCVWGVFATRCGVNEKIVEEKFELVMGSRLVYPDGTISKPASLLLNAFVASCLPKPPSRSKNKPTP